MPPPLVVDPKAVCFLEDRSFAAILGVSNLAEIVRRVASCHGMRATTYTGLDGEVATCSLYAEMRHDFYSAKLQIVAVGTYLASAHWFTQEAEYLRRESPSGRWSTFLLLDAARSYAACTFLGWFEHITLPLEISEFENSLESIFTRFSNEQCDR